MGAACSAHPERISPAIAPGGFGSLFLFVGEPGMMWGALADLQERLSRVLSDRTLSVAARQAALLDALPEDHPVVLPPTLRWALWPALLRAQDVWEPSGPIATLHEASDNYNRWVLTHEGVDGPLADALGVIDRDVPRTAPELSLFGRVSAAFRAASLGPDDDESLRLSLRRGTRALRRVLRWYAACDSDVQYCQGLNFLAAQLLLVGMNPKAAFSCMLALCRSRNCSIGSLFEAGMETPRALTRACRLACKDRAPHAFSVLQRVGGAADISLVPWFLASGSAAKLPWSSMLAMTDALVVEVARTQAALDPPEDLREHVEAWKASFISGDGAPPVPTALRAVDRVSILGERVCEGAPWLQPKTALSISWLITRREMLDEHEAGDEESLAAVLPPQPRVKDVGERFNQPVTLAASAIASLRCTEHQWKLVARNLQKFSSRKGVRLAAVESAAFESAFGLTQQRWLEAARREMESDTVRSAPVMRGMESRTLTLATPVPIPVPGEGLDRTMFGVLEDDSLTDETDIEVDRVARSVLLVRGAASTSHISPLGGGPSKRSDLSIVPALPHLPAPLREPRRRRVFRAHSGFELPVSLPPPVVKELRALLRRSVDGGSLFAVYAKPQELTEVDGQLCWKWMHPGEWARGVFEEHRWLSALDRGASRLHRHRVQAETELGFE
jgi:hypothetical protein